MPLPTASIAWPPEHCHQPRELYDQWAAWYSGDPNRLAEVYTKTTIAGRDPKGWDRPAQYRGGLVGAIARFFWGQPINPGQLSAHKLHVPLAADVAAASADLLFAEPPALTIADADETTQARLAELADDSMHARLLEAAELAAAYGGVYLRIAWDESIAAHPLIEAVTPDTAVPEWRFGRLAAVTFWRVVADDQGDVWRHLEHREPGRILHGLYKGTSSKLGRPMALADHPATEPLVGLVDEQGAITTGAAGLAAVYVPNMRPHRTLRGSPLGRSDYAGVEHLLDALDEAWTSWMRDLRLGKARLLVPDNYLESAGKGQGALFDADREVFTTLNMMPKPGGLGGPDMIMAQQFKIRVDEHERTCRNLAAQVTRGAGYSTQTLGESAEGSGPATTATEIHARNRRSYTTRDRKINYWRAELRRLWADMLAVDAAVFGSKITPAPPAIEWPDAVTPDPESVARTVQLLDAAGAVSTRTKVALVHPDWDGERVDTETQAILAEHAEPAVADPLAGLPA